MIKILLNGQERTVEPGSTVESLLARLELPAARVAVERNRRIVPRSCFGSERVEAGDTIEVITLVGGG